MLDVRRAVVVVLTLAAMHLVLAFSRIDSCILSWQQIVNNIKRLRLTLEREAPNCTLPVSIPSHYYEPK